MGEIYPIILAGGSGTRLWPLSRKSYPKQFSPLLGEDSLFQRSALRLITSDQIDFQPHIILTNSDFRFIVCDQLQSVGIEPEHILIEPETKNTAPAILAASLYAQLINPDAIVLVAPSDHHIPDSKSFHAAIKTGLAHAKNGKVVTFGITPTQPETAYGYLELSKMLPTSDGAQAVKRFIEKPSLSEAQLMLHSGDYLWNAGIFLFKADDMIRAFCSHAPEILELTSSALNSGKPDLGFFRLNPEAWNKLTSISIDYAIMEKIDNLISIPFSSKWSDLGSWDSVWLESNKDQFGVAQSISAHAIDCRNTILRSEDKAVQLVGLGLDNIIAVAMPDAVLVASKERAQDVKSVVEYLKRIEIEQAEIFPKEYRPWGWFECLAMEDNFQVKRICVEPGAALSLQSHQYRSEHWVLVEGIAKVSIDDEVRIIGKGESVYVPLGAIHRLENPGDVQTILIEIQVGTYFGEDDIVRYSDAYGRK